MKPFFWRIVICLVPVALAAFVVGRAYTQYMQGRGGFKMGVDLEGGTILVYEVDPDRSQQGTYKIDELAAALKRRIDPADLYNVTIRPVSDTRVEIILPTGGRKRAEAAQHLWDSFLAEVKEKWPEGNYDDVPRGRVTELAARIKQKHEKATPEEIEAFVAEHYKDDKGRRDLTGEEVQRIKDLISRSGRLEFRVLANEVDDKAAIDAARAFLRNPKNQAELEALALAGKPPPPPVSDNGTLYFETSSERLQGPFSYAWVELGKNERRSLNLDNAAENDTSPRDPDNPRSGSRNAFWQEVAAARNRQPMPEPVTAQNGTLLFSRKVQQLRMSEKDQDKQVEYFFLTRVTPEEKRVVGDNLTAFPTQDDRLQPAVGFTFDSEGGERFYEMTSTNTPTGAQTSKFQRHLAIILDGLIESAPVVESAIRSNGIIRGNYTAKEVNTLVQILRSGPLSATLKSVPVSENTMGATLGQDTIDSGTRAVFWAFVAVLAFMLVYYRFAGLVACIALFANLLLTVAFMVFVSATFTLPGLAGLVLTLGMAVDANILIYERLREERERGAGLALALRNGYDRAFPTIIDTHLSSIFTAVVLYVVGNDQLKGFGISLATGLIISLFTSLYMTRTIFDLGLARGWLTQLSMMRLFARPNINFMGIRYQMFALTTILSLLGVAVFLYRGKAGLNIDFTGGTAYGGLLTEFKDARELRALFADARQHEHLVLADNGVRQLDDRGREFEVTYKSGSPKKITLAGDPATEAEVGERVKRLPDLSIEQIFLTSETFSRGDTSRAFTIRTSEKEPEIVLAAINRLLGDQLEKIRLTKFEVAEGNRTAKLTFSDFASPAQVSRLIARELKARQRELPEDADEAARKSLGQEPQVGRAEGAAEKDGRFQEMVVTFGDPLSRDAFTKVLERAQTEFDSSPQPERLETFDPQLAAETQGRAMTAIVASWGAILLYLWFRFGNWTFGLAAVICLIHDLCLTLGAIAACHFLVDVPVLGSALLLQDFKIDLPAIAALLTLVGYSVNDTIVVFDRIREVRGKNPLLTATMINDSINQTLSRTVLASLTTWLVVFVLYGWGGAGVHLFAFCMVIGVIIGTYSSIYIASPLLLLFGEGTPAPGRERPVEAGAAR